MLLPEIQTLRFIYKHINNKQTEHIEYTLDMLILCIPKQSERN